MPSAPMRHASLKPLAPTCLSAPFLVTCKSCNFGTPRPSVYYDALRHPCITNWGLANHLGFGCKFPSSNVLLTRGLGGLWVVHYMTWKMNYCVAWPVHLKLQIPKQEVSSYSRT
ncbi:unnamed protein product [Prunus armeniaca]